MALWFGHWIPPFNLILPSDSYQQKPEWHCLYPQHWGVSPKRIYNLPHNACKAVKTVPQTDSSLLLKKKKKKKKKNNFCLYSFPQLLILGCETILVVEITLWACEISGWQTGTFYKMSWSFFSFTSLFRKPVFHSLK